MWVCSQIGVVSALKVRGIQERLPINRNGCVTEQPFHHKRKKQGYYRVIFRQNRVLKHSFGVI
jgi:hypothetical protein